MLRAALTRTTRGHHFTLSTRSFGISMASVERPAKKAKLNPKVDYTQSVTVGTTRWLRLETLTYNDQTGSARKWDRAVRTTKTDEDSTGAHQCSMRGLDTPALLRCCARRCGGDPGDPGRARGAAAQPLRQKPQLASSEPGGGERECVDRKIL